MGGPDSATTQVFTVWRRGNCGARFCDRTNRSNRKVAPGDSEKPDANPIRKSRLDDWRLKPKQLGDQPNKKGGFDMQLNAIDEFVPIHRSDSAPGHAGIILGSRRHSGLTQTTDPGAGSKSP